MISKSPEEHVEISYLRHFVNLDAHPEGPQPFVHHLNVQLFHWGFQDLRGVYNCSNWLQFQVLLNLRDLTRNTGYLTGLETLHWEQQDRFKEDRQNASDEEIY